MLKLTEVAYQNPGDCKHLKITVNDDGDVHEIPWTLHETQVIQLAKDVRQLMNVPEGSEADALLILWLIVQNKLRGKSVAQCIDVDIDA